jgi:acetyl esterase/lipase
MRLRTGVLLAAGLLCGACAPPYLTPSGPAPLRYRDLVFGAVTKTTGITYGSAVNLENQTITLTMDEYAPTGDAVTKRPAIIWVHGGSFAVGDSTEGDIVDEANTAAKEGYVNFSINYRLEPGGCSAGNPSSTCVQAITESMQDAQTAIRFVKAHATTYGVDTSRVAIAGTSAGAITAMNVNYASSSSDPASAVRAGVSLSGADLLSKEDKGDPPALLFHGTADPLVPYQWAVRTVDNAHTAGLLAWLTTWQGAGHVPYGQHRQEILDQTRNFLYWALDAAHAAR